MLELANMLSSWNKIVVIIIIIFIIIIIIIIISDFRWWGI